MNQVKIDCKVPMVVGSHYEQPCSMSVLPDTLGMLDTQASCGEL
jgi:hypothetical protein